ncbi:MAG: hypothetical protein LBP52_10215 [Burkholderiaceae bacterium]|nr:hypothetical protein [Burkholderiaceae bacterium]
MAQLSASPRSSGQRGGKPPAIGSAVGRSDGAAQSAGLHLCNTLPVRPYPF